VDDRQTTYLNKLGTKKHTEKGVVLCLLRRAAAVLRCACRRRRCDGDGVVFALHESIGTGSDSRTSVFLFPGNV
jgi:hypothetical protein